MSGASLWARAYRLPQAIGTAVVLAYLIRLLLAALAGPSGGTTIGPVWISLVVAIPLLRAVSAETPHHACMPRSLRLRRSALLAVIVLTMVVLSFALYPTNLTDFGSLATLRDCLALLGLGLLCGRFTGPRWLWIPPMLVGLCSCLFSWPLYPTTAHTVWGVLRAPGVLRYPDATWDLSIPLAVVLAAGGICLYLLDSRYFLHGSARSASSSSIPALARPRGAASDVRAGRRLIRRGWSRASCAPMAAVACAVAVV